MPTRLARPILLAYRFFSNCLNEGHLGRQVLSAFAIILVLGLYSINPLFGQSTIGGSYLLVGVGAAEMGSGGTFVAYGSGPHSLYWNPAGLATGDDNEATVSYMSWIANANIFSLSSRLNAGKNAAWGFGIETVSLGTLEARDEPGEPLGSFSADFNIVSAAYARKIGKLNLGLTAKYLSERLFEERADGYAIDLGAQSKFLEDRLSVGLSVHNLGSIENFGFNNTELPRIVRAGVHAKVFTVFSAEDRSPMATAFTVAEVEHLQNLEITRMHYALIVDAFEAVEGRIGYVTNNEANALSFGLGFYHSNFKFDFAYLPFKLGFGSAGQVVSISYAW